MTARRRELAIRAFRRAARELRLVFEHDPTLQIYITNDMHLLSGDSHDGLGEPRPDRIIATEPCGRVSGGDW